MAKTFAIDDDVRDVISRSSFKGNSVTLPPGQLPRDLYTKVDKVFKAVGGKWSRKAGAHVFGSDPREVLNVAVETGKARNLQQETQFFPTPPEIASRVIELANIGTCHKVLEPSAGSGNLIRAIPNALSRHIRVIAVENDMHHFQSLTAVDIALFVTFREGDFLEYEGADGPFDRVVMNPPFERATDIKHIERALSLLKTDGRLVSVLANGPKQREAFYDRSSQWIDLPKGSFSAVGTNVETAIVVIDN